jgi:uncharacterized Zn finger protein
VYAVNKLPEDTSMSNRMDSKPYWAWMHERDGSSSVFHESFLEYTGLGDIPKEERSGCFTQDEIQAYKHTHAHFWFMKLRDMDTSPYMATRLYGADREDLRKILSKMQPETLANALAEIYANLFCDERGIFNDEESLAADSAGDFVEACDMMFQRLDQEWECRT